MLNFNLKLSLDDCPTVLNKLPKFIYLKQRFSLWRTYLPYAFRKKILKKNRPMDRTQLVVANEYQKIYNPTNNEWVNERNVRKDLYLFRNQLIQANGWLPTKAYNRIFNEIINSIGATKVLEVGSGRGKNIIFQSLNNTDIKFTGLEYSENGVRNGNELIKKTPSELVKVSGFDSLTENQKQALSKNVQFIQGSAFELPFENKSFDISYTCLVLEQMPYDYEKAIKEMIRVTRKACIFIEPFSDANQTLGRLYLEHKDYFRFSYHSFEKLGLKPVFFSDDLPQKIKYSIGALVCMVPPV